MEVKQMTNVCKYCDEGFDSRNALFRHLRSSNECYSRAQQSTGVDNSIFQLEKRKVAINFGYHILDIDGASSCANEEAAEAVYRSFFQTLRTLYPATPVEDAEGDTTFTLSSAAHLRHPSLMQEKTCSAWSDVVGFNYKGGPKDLDTTTIVKCMQNFIVKEKSPKDSRGLSCIQVLNVESLMISTKFHAEKSCSQRAYQYLMPIKWLDDSQETQDWIRRKAGVYNGHQIKICKTPQSLVVFKKALKLAESRDVTHASSTAVSSAGRFGNLWQKERRPLHNFCDPSLGFMASPSNEHVWRSIDKARLSGFAVHNDEAFVVIEFKGDGFVVQQIRRIIASAVAMSNEWLPFEYFDVAMRQDISVETPIAPSGLLYLSSARFHFLDLIKGSTLFEANNKSSHPKEEWINSLQARLLHERSAKVEEEVVWLRDLKNTVSSRILSRLDQIKFDDNLKEEQVLRKQKEHVIEQEELQKIELTVHETPEAYRKTLSLLRDVCNDKKWPLTSDARSRVIRSPIPIEKSNAQLKHRAASSQFQGHLYQCGSFTVVNNELFKENLPKVNKIFPELVNAIFELEEICSSMASQSCLRNECNESGSTFAASTHCAVNRNVEYTPHFDNGIGQKHTFSTIIGLGDYTGGELIVDSNSYNIRYEALKFDGWKQMHSTTKTRGERFSLVWFTPERRQDDASTQESNFEDTKAATLINTHTLLLPNFPILRFRHNSTDALVINEILDIDQGCTYELSPGTWNSMTKKNTEKSQLGFTLKGHKVVLDIGAHIGIFSRYALSVGCERIIAYEPESENLALLKLNLNYSVGAKKIVEIHSCAIANGESGIKNLVHARNRTDGSLNTWRHSLEEYSQYVDKKGTNLLSENQGAILTRCEVPTVPVFGIGGALLSGISFVKMDCEGAEIDILLSTESSQSSSWKDVTHLVFEWSFTKERRVHIFHKALDNLESAGFEVVYEGQGSWWDTELNCMWPYHSDLVVFAKRSISTS